MLSTTVQTFAIFPDPVQLSPYLEMVERPLHSLKQPCQLSNSPLWYWEMNIKRDKDPAEDANLLRVH